MGATPKQDDPAANGLTAAQVARKLGVHAQTVRRWADAGRLNAVKDAAGVRWFDADEVEALVAELSDEDDDEDDEKGEGNGANGPSPLTSDAISKRLMQHLETIHRQRHGVVDDQRGQISDLRAELKLARDRIQELESKHMEVLKVFEELQTERHKRELEWWKAQREEKVYDEIGRNISLLGPVLINRIAGRPLLPAADLRVQAVEALVMSLTPQQRAALLGSLDPAQAAVVQDLFVEVAEARAARERAEGGRPPRTEAPSAESEKGGDGGTAS